MPIHCSVFRSVVIWQMQILASNIVIINGIGLDNGLLVYGN